MIAKPQAPGMETPHPPTPLSTSHVTPITTPIATVAARNRPPIIAQGVFAVRTIPAIFCVTLLKLCPGAITAYSPVRGSIIGSIALSGSWMGPWVAMLCKLRVRVDHAGRVRSPRTEVEIGEHLVIALFSFAPDHPAVRIVQVAEDDRVGWARLLASSQDLAILDRAIVLVGVDFDGLNALHAVAALLHDAARTHRDIRIAHELEALGVIVRVKQEVEPAHLVDAVV